MIELNKHKRLPSQPVVGGLYCKAFDEEAGTQWYFMILGIEEVIVEGETKYSVQILSTDDERAIAHWTFPVRLQWWNSSMIRIK